MTAFRSTADNGQPALEFALNNLAEEILQSVVTGGFCTVQDWDNRIDCCIRLADGQIVGEMVPLATLTPAVLLEVGHRLKTRSEDGSLELQNELTPPILIKSSS